MGSPAEHISPSKVNIARQASAGHKTGTVTGQQGGHQQEPRVNQPGRPVLVPRANPDEFKEQVVSRSRARGLAPRTHFRPCRENSRAHLGATAHRRSALPPGSSHLNQAALQSSGWRLQTRSRTCRPAGSALTSGEAATQPGSPGPAARNDISPLSWRGAHSTGMQEGPLSGGGRPGSWRQPQFFFVFFSP